MGIFKNMTWKAVLGIIKEFFIALGRGDLLLRMRVDRALPYILWTFFLGCMSIWWSYMAEQTMLKVKNNENQLKELKIKHAQYTYELVQMDRAGKVADILEMMGSDIEPPHKPADVLKK